jgi:glycosyltransferase involved in cell wall biosynthesis
MIERLPLDVRVTVVVPAARTEALPYDRDNIVIRPFRYAPKSLQVLVHEPGGIPVALHARRWTYLLLPGLLAGMFISCLRHGRIDSVIHANWAICGCIAGAAGKFLGVPVVTTLRGDDISRAQRSWLDRWILSLCIKWSVGIISVSRSIEAWTRAQFPDHAGKICLIENGVDDSFLALPVKRDVAEPALLRLLTVGSLIPRKGLDQIIIALSRLPQLARVSLKIVGEGPEYTRLVHLVDTLGLKNCVEFIGTLPPTAMPAEFARADIFVLASHSEGRPNVVLEAMASALPVIASDIPGVDELVSHGQTGFLFRSGAIDQLTQYIQTLLENATLREQFGRAGRDFILRRQLRWSATAEHYLHLYRKISRNKRPCAE